MRKVIVGTAGHIDHGKTSLVKALTGIDCDRWAEEKARGITIDLGFAHLKVQRPEGDLQIGFVDVPGHERFLHNALAGLGGIRIMLLVVAADEGVKPQTRGHLAVCSLFGIPAGIPRSEQTARCSRVCGFTPSSAATTRSMMRMPPRPASALWRKRSWPGTSTKPIWRSPRTG